MGKGDIVLLAAFMKILIIHYHLRTGGVTKVIQAQTHALQGLGHEVVVASSGPAAGSPVAHLTVPELDYQEAGSIPLAELWNVEADLWIIHNPTLGLNSGFPDLIESAAGQGIPLLLQCHDFAEDGRPSNFQLLKKSPHLYPLAPHVHYAAMNRRDHSFLIAAGVPPNQCHFLPNPIVPPALPDYGKKSSAKKEKLVFYPVRGIRRKNLGEVCLLAQHAPPDTRFAVSLRATSEESPVIHDEWVEFARELNLPIEFDVVGKAPDSFPSWLQKATHFVTTSISEGFGLTFLEPAALGKPLIGRNLPEITCDFTPYGTLYPSILVPLEAVPGLKKHFTESLIATLASYQKSLASDEIEFAWKALTANDSVDFGNLPESLQRHVIRTHPLPHLASWLAQALEQPATRIDLTPWSLDSYAQRLQKTMQSFGLPGSVKWLPNDAFLQQFVTPERFHFLRNVAIKATP